MPSIGSTGGGKRSGDRKRRTDREKEKSDSSGLYRLSPIGFTDLESAETGRYQQNGEVGKEISENDKGNKWVVLSKRTQRNPRGEWSPWEGDGDAHRYGLKRIAEELSAKGATGRAEDASKRKSTSYEMEEPTGRHQGGRYGGAEKTGGAQEREKLGS